MTHPNEKTDSTSPPEGSPKANLFVRMWDATFCWRTARRILIALAILGTLIATIYVIEGIRGRSAWAKFEAEMKAAGLPLDPRELKPPAVPDDENFAMTPLLAPLLNYKYMERQAADVPGFRQTVWADEAGKQRLDDYPGIEDTRQNPLSNRHRGRLTDLGPFQGWIRNSTNFSLPKDQLSEPIAHADESGTGMSLIGYDTNFAAKEILLGLTKFDPEMNELHAAAKRPHAQFPIHYDEGFETLLPHLNILRKFGRIAHLKAIALLAENRPDDALEELLLIIRFSESYRNEPILISGLVHIANLSQVSGIVWEGLARKIWTPKHLAVIEKRLRPVDFVSAYELAMRGERAFAVNTLWQYRQNMHRSDQLGVGNAGSWVFRLAPDGMFLHNLVNMGRMYNEYALVPIDLENKIIDLKRSREVQEAMETMMAKPYPYHLLTALVFPAFSKALLRYAHAQSECDQIRLACALEQFRAKHGNLPTTLAELSPAYLPSLPHDPVNGNGYVYRPDDGDYIIYSLGADNDDNGGKIALDSGKNKHKRTILYEQGDWVWNSAVAED